jgi:curved DNA-binding protein
MELMMNCSDHYCTLGIDRMATDDDVRRAYRRLARRFHPDVTEDADGERKFKAVGEAYKTLRRAASRSAYNRQLVSNATPPDGDAWIAFPPDLGFALFPWPFLMWLWWN